MCVSTDGKIAELDFGDYCLIKQKRYGVPNEQYLYKVINRLNSNCYVDVPVNACAVNMPHEKTVPVYSCICCGIDETEVLKFRVEDVKPHSKKIIQRDPICPKASRCANTPGGCKCPENVVCPL